MVDQLRNRLHARWQRWRSPLAGLAGIAMVAGLVVLWVKAPDLYTTRDPEKSAVTAANTPDSFALIPLVPAIPAIGSRRGPRRRRPAKLHADTGDDDHRRTWLRQHRITPRIARRGVQTSDRLGRHRWVIERSLAWLTGYRRLTLRTLRPAVHRIPHPRGHAHLRQETPHVRQALRLPCLPFGFTRDFRA